VRALAFRICRAYDVFMTNGTRVVEIRTGRAGTVTGNVVCGATAFRAYNPSQVRIAWDDGKVTVRAWSCFRYRVTE
jgi:hypothetical protein